MINWYRDIPWYDAPQVELLSWPAFKEPEHMPIAWLGDSVSAERLIEFAGRLCYMSQSNPASKPTYEYIDNIKKQKHGSVTEHANFSILLEGVSRTLTHELVRHRAGMAYSQLSQRYVDESEVAFVMPPALLTLVNDRGQATRDRWCEQMLIARNNYRETVEQLLAQIPDEQKLIMSRVDLRKQVREAARSVLPNATETKIVITGNVRAWHWFFELRGALGADAEIRRAALSIYSTLVTSNKCGSLFDDVAIQQIEGKDCLVTERSKY